MPSKDGYQFIKGEKVLLNPETGGSNNLNWDYAVIKKIIGDGITEEARLISPDGEEFWEYTFNLLPTGINFCSE